MARASPRVSLSPKTVVTKYRRCRPVPPQLGHCRKAQVDRAPEKRPVPLQIRHLRNGVSETDTSHMTKPTATVMTAPVPGSCVPAVPRANITVNTTTHRMPVIVPPAPGKRNRQPSGHLVSFDASAGSGVKGIRLPDTALLIQP